LITGSDLLSATDSLFLAALSCCFDSINDIRLTAKLTLTAVSYVQFSQRNLGQCLEADMRLLQMFWWSQFPKQMFWWYQVTTSVTFSRYGCYIWPLANCTLLVMHLFGFS